MNSNADGTKKKTPAAASGLRFYSREEGMKRLERRRKMQQKQAEEDADPEKQKEKWRERRAGYEETVAKLDSNKIQKAQDLWIDFDGKKLEPALHSSAIALLDAAWLVEFALYSDDPQPILPCRQQLPTEAFLSLEQIRDITSMGTLGDKRPLLHIIVLSYMWLHPAHPDPQGITLKTVADRCQELLKTVTKYPPRWAIFWDFASLHQHPDPANGNYRTPHENKLFKEGLDSLGLLFSHPNTTCFRLTTLPKDYPRGYDLPENANCATYWERGWPFVESCWMSMSQVHEKVDTIAYGEKFSTWNMSNMKPEVQKRSSRYNIEIPLSPAKMWERLQNKSFTNAKDDRPLVVDLYKFSFFNFFEDLRDMKYSKKGGPNSQCWTNQNLKDIAEIIDSGYTPNLESITLHGQTNCGFEGFKALGNALSGPKAPEKIRRLDFGKTAIGDRGVCAMSSVLVNMKRLDLSETMIGMRCCDVLAQAALKNEGGTAKWEELDLSGNPFIDDRTILDLVPALPNCMVRLDLQGTDIGKEGVGHLAHILVKVQDLNLSSCNLGVQGCRALAQAAFTSPNKPHWKHLNLSKNPLIGNQGIAFILPILQSLDLLSLDVAYTGMDQRRCQLLIQTLLGTSAVLFHLRLMLMMGPPVQVQDHHVATADEVDDTTLTSCFSGTLSLKRLAFGGDSTDSAFSATEGFVSAISFLAEMSPDLWSLKISGGGDFRKIKDIIRQKAPHVRVEFNRSPKRK